MCYFKRENQNKTETTCRLPKEKLPRCRHIFKGSIFLSGCLKDENRVIKTPANTDLRLNINRVLTLKAQKVQETPLWSSTM